MLSKAPWSSFLVLITIVISFLLLFRFVCTVLQHLDSKFPEDRDHGCGSVCVCPAPSSCSLNKYLTTLWVVPNRIPTLQMRKLRDKVVMPKVSWFMNEDVGLTLGRAGYSMYTFTSCLRWFLCNLHRLKADLTSHLPC